VSFFNFVINPKQSRFLISYFTLLYSLALPICKFKKDFFTSKSIEDIFVMILPVKALQPLQPTTASCRACTSSAFNGEIFRIAFFMVLTTLNQF